MEDRKLRICIDLDGTICTIKKPDESYADVKVMPGAKEFIDSLKADGHTIIINTARNMQTQGHNVGKVMKNVGKITLDWLEENGIQFLRVDLFVFFFHKYRGLIGLAAFAWIVLVQYHRRRPQSKEGDT